MGSIIANPGHGASAGLGPMSCPTALKFVTHLQRNYGVPQPSVEVGTFLNIAVTATKTSVRRLCRRSRHGGVRPLGTVGTGSAERGACITVPTVMPTTTPAVPEVPRREARVTQAAAQSSASTTADVIVVGAGPAGSSAAYHMATLGLDVILLEKQELGRRQGLRGRPDPLGRCASSSPWAWTPPAGSATAACASSAAVTSSTSPGRSRPPSPPTGWPAPAPCSTGTWPSTPPRPEPVYSPA